MRRIKSHLLGVDRGSLVLFSDFEHDGEMWTGKGPREFRSAVSFSEPFLAPPEVTVTMSMWDLDHQTNQRVDLSAEKVTGNNFEIVFRTWGDTRVARVRADWMAIGEITDEDIWDV